MARTKTIRIGLTPSGIRKTISEYESWRKHLLEKTKEFLRALAEEGVEVANVNFQSAVYDGTNDVTVQFEERNDTKVAVVATGNAVLFIEFGSGITYMNIHPEGDKLGMERGEYGYHLGSLPGGWRYHGDPGTHGKVIERGKHAGMVHTLGNPANMAMYRSKEELENRFAEIARRIFS